MAAASSRLFVHAVVLLLAAAAGSPAASAARLGMRYRVGGPDGWRVPPPEDKEMYYVNWASPIAFYVETPSFVYRYDSVIKVSKAGYYHCNETAGIGAGAGAVPRDGSTLFLLDAPGYAYFASAGLDHCNKGERLMVNVLAAETPSPSSPSPAAAPATSLLSPLSSPSPAPAPSMEYATAAGTSLVASFAHALLAPVTLALAGLV